LKVYPALDVRSGSGDLIQAIVDDFEPTAIEERDKTIRIFFVCGERRDGAAAALSHAGYATAAIEVPDEDWARRSQEHLSPIAIGRIVIVPSPESRLPSPAPVPSLQPPVTIVIQPSMGFGTGHHATTRLCLAALQTLDLSTAFLLDIGTGSGVLAIAAARLGAARALGIDSDPDALQSARENLALNPDAGHVDFELADLTSAALPQADVVTANLTGTLLVRAAGILQRAVRPGGSLIVSGLLTDERASVRAAFSTMHREWEADEDGWGVLLFRRHARC
jgi:ribosomal protein L11 methyltransferase